MRRARGLRWRISGGLLGYSVLLGGTLLYAGYLTNEKIEQTVWQSLLNAEADRFLAHLEQNPNYPLPRGGTVHGYLVPHAGGASLPEALAPLPVGFHNDVPFAGHEASVLVRALPSGRSLVLAVDAGPVERNQRRLVGWTLFWALLGVGVLVVAVYALTSRLLRPISNLIRDIDALRPERAATRLLVDHAAPEEVAVISDSINRHLVRIEGFIVREREFIDTMSHELRTPLAALRGAVDVLETSSTSASDVARISDRMRQTLMDSEQLVETLLLLAREPSKIHQHEEAFELSGLLRDIIEAHGPLALDRGVRVQLESARPLAVSAPPRAVVIAVGNLLRNAIEHGAGTVRVRVVRDSTVEIEAQSAGATPAEIARLYGEAARDGRTRQGGIGLPLVARLCQHLGWQVSVDERPDGAAVTRLRLVGASST